MRQRGDVTVWLSPEVEAAWRADRRKTRGGPPVYSDLAITVCLTLGIVYKQPLRQTEGFVRSLMKIMGLDLAVPDCSTFSRHGSGLVLPLETRAQTNGPIHLVVDSTGLKIFGEGEWLENKHKTKARRKAWRKLHLGSDLASGDLVCSDLTEDSVGDTMTLGGPPGSDRRGGVALHCRRGLRRRSVERDIAGAVRRRYSDRHSATKVRDPEHRRAGQPHAS
ncbi:IS5 family transposase [Roseinatronobacter sp. HJB301]|uniref:IS5 family transposase n=1 Tax=Roseinatronobacter alkalisoli TaxID=3028235 RepID=A0ABT5TC79_9RHOB|nr:IS5 family transposase [Roseinatronobacter sp. HJB301]MDD7972735.1 IS5 family transposase [Roseinatronobacter sp. HJB301]